MYLFIAVHFIVSGRRMGHAAFSIIHAPPGLAFGPTTADRRPLFVRAGVRLQYLIVACGVVMMNGGVSRTSRSRDRLPGRRAHGPLAEHGWSNG